MKKILVVLVCIGHFIALSQDFNPDQQITELTKKNNIGVASGYSVNGETKWQGSAGYLCQNDQEKFTPTSQTRIASVAKSMTAVAVMQLVDSNELSLDEPIGSFNIDIPEDKQKITMRQLLSHTAGIPGYKGKKELENKVQFNNLTEAMNVFIDRPLLFQPGSKYSYSSYGYVVIGVIIETITGMSYEDYMKKNIFEPAEMKNTFVEKFGETYDLQSCLYTSNGKKAKSAKQNNLSNRVPGGGFLSTAEDLIKFGNALLNKKLISKESLNTMLEFPAVLFPGNTYALGWTLYGPEGQEKVVIGHSGGQTGCTSQLMIIPQTKTVVVVLSNTSGNYPDIVSFASNLIGFSEK